MGAPGSYYWTGTIKVYNLTSDSFYSLNKEDVDSHRYSYLGENLLMRTAVCQTNLSRAVTDHCLCPGYAVTAGHFSSPDVIDIAAGAPQHSGSGKVGIRFLFPTVQSMSSYVAPVICLSPAQVYIFKIDGTTLVKSFQASGKMV